MFALQQGLDVIWPFNSPLLLNHIAVFSDLYNYEGRLFFTSLKMFAMQGLHSSAAYVISFLTPSLCEYRHAVSAQYDMSQRCFFVSQLLCRIVAQIIMACIPIFCLVGNFFLQLFAQRIQIPCF